MPTLVATPLSRRRFLTAAGAFAVTPRAFLGQTATQTATGTEIPQVVVQGRIAGAAAKITTKTLRRNVSCLMGSGGNIAVLPGKQGKLLVDSGYSTSRPQITEALTALGPDPLTHLINTHWHFDHTDGNEWMHAAGATILAHENTKIRLSAPQFMAALHATIPAAPAGAIPTQIFTGQHIDLANGQVLATVKGLAGPGATFILNGETLHLQHYDPAHTDTDISIHFQEADVFHTGDTWFNGFYPFIDYSTGGTIDGMIAASKRTLATVSATTIIIPGHGPVGDKAQLTSFSEMLIATRGAVAALKQQGKSIEETIAAKPTAAFDDQWGKGFMNAETYTRLVYQGV